MSKRMYLVRRENCRFIGPLTIDGFREGLRKMDFGVQDEVCGHCSPWAILDHEDSIKRQYPELARIVAEEMPAAWREMTDHAKLVTRKERKIRNSTSPERSSNRSSSSSSSSTSRRSGRQKKPLPRTSAFLKNGMIAATLLIAVSLGGYTWNLRSRDEPLPPIGELAQLASDPDPNKFLNEMGLRMVPIVNRVAHGKDEKGTWLPYLRMYAFHTNGMIENLPIKTLRGSVPAYAPIDCSVDSWRKRWIESSPQIDAWMQGSSLQKNQWTKALAWDPYWIRRRTSKGWIKPRNWFEGCLMAATVALRSITDDMTAQKKSKDPSPGQNAELIAAVNRRLKNQIETIQSGKSSLFSGESKDVFSVLSCLEVADSPKALGSCHASFSDTSVSQMLDEHHAWQLVRLALSPSANQVSTEIRDEIVSSSYKASNEDSFTKLDYTLENKMIAEWTTNGFKTEGLNERIMTEFAESKPSPDTR